MLNHTYPPWYIWDDVVRLWIPKVKANKELSIAYNVPTRLVKNMDLYWSAIKVKRIRRQGEVFSFRWIGDIKVEDVAGAHVGNQQVGEIEPTISDVYL